MPQLATPPVSGSPRPYGMMSRRRARLGGDGSASEGESSATDVATPPPAPSPAAAPGTPGAAKEEAPEDEVVLAAKRGPWNAHWLPLRPEAWGLRGLCMDILNRLRSDVNAEHFNDPVDWEALGLDDYPLCVPGWSGAAQIAWRTHQVLAMARPVARAHSVVRRPMDLGTVQKKLLRGEYGTVAAFRSDIILVFENCVLYNKPGSRIVQQVRGQRKAAVHVAGAAPPLTSEAR